MGIATEQALRTRVEDQENQIRALTEANRKFADQPQLRRIHIYGRDQASKADIWIGEHDQPALEDWVTAIKDEAKARITALENEVFALQASNSKLHEALKAAEADRDSLLAQPRADEPEAPEVSG